MSFLTRKALPRRTVLKGLGATVALPMLDAMVPALRASTKPAHRFLTFYVPNGMAMEYWTPKGEGNNFELSEILRRQAEAVETHRFAGTIAALACQRGVQPAGIERHRFDRPLEKTERAVANADRRPAVAVMRPQRHGADGGIQSRAIAAAGQDADSLGHAAPPCLL